MSSPKFMLGTLVMTAGIEKDLDPFSLVPYIRRHMYGDWGEIDSEDKRANDYAVDHGGRLLSSYTVKPGVVIWIITEADRSVTTVLYPDEY